MLKSTTIIVRHFDLFHTLEEEKKKTDALVDILINLMEKNPEKLHCMVVPSTVELNQAQQRSHSTCWQQHHKVCPKLRRKPPPVQLPVVVETHQESV
jgi:hypothetical protein